MSYYLFLSKENPMEVGRVFTQGKFRTFILPITGRHSLFPSSHTCITLYLPYDKPTFCNEGVVKAYDVPHE